MEEPPNKVSLKSKIEAMKLVIHWTWKTSPHMFLIILLVTILGGALALIEPFILKVIIDRITIENSSVGTGLAIGLLGVIVVYGVARLFQEVSWDIQTTVKKMHAQRLERYVSMEVMKKVSSLDAIYFESPEYYNILNKANQNFWRISESFWHITILLGQTISVAVISITLLYYDWRIFSLIVLASIPSILFSLRSKRMIWGIFDATSPVSQEAGYYKRLLTERPEAVKEVRMYGLSTHFLSKFEKLITTFINKQDRGAYHELRYLLLVSLFQITFSMMAAWVVIVSYISGAITIGTLTLLWALLFQFAAHLRWVVRTISMLSEMGDFITPYIGLMEFVPTIKESVKPINFPEKMAQGIVFEKVSFNYPGAKKKSLNEVSFSIKPGQSVAIVGENGSGKTTMIKLLARLYDPTSGRIMIDGKDMKEYSIDSLHENIGIIFQDFMKYEGLIKENIGYGRVSHVGKSDLVHEAAKKSGAWEFIKEFDEQYKEHLGRTLKESGTELSVGQWQKIALARVFFRNPSILVLDEPTAAIDARAEYELFKKFKSLTKDKITLLISHRFSTVRMADVIIVVHNGQVVEKGSHNQLLAINGRYAKLFRMQAEGYKE